MTNAEVWFNIALRPRKPEGSLGRTARTATSTLTQPAPELWYGGGGRGRLYTYRHTVTTRMTSELRWAAMRAILMFHNREGQSHKTVSTDYNVCRKRTAEADSNQGPSAYQPEVLSLGQTGSQSVFFFLQMMLNVLGCRLTY